MDMLAELGRLLGFTFAAGINLYATVALMGLAAKFGWVALPAQYQVFAADWVIYTALALYVIEFLADKIPWLDSAWDAVHTFIRPVGGAAIAVISLGPQTPTLTAISALIGGLVAGSTHVTKAGTRVLANASPEPFSNWALSLGEDALVVSLGFVALKYPLVALGVTAVLLFTIGLFAMVIIRAFRRRFSRGRDRDSGASGSAATALLLVVAFAGAQTATTAAREGQAPRPPAGTPPAVASVPTPAAASDAERPQQPVFRAGANFVRVDAYAMKDGVAVTDLTAEDFEVIEDGVRQKVESFEHVTVSAGGVPASRVEPRSVRESRAMAADPRARVFVVFLDLWHMKRASGYNVRRPLVNLLNRVIGDDDLVAIMTPQMSALDIMFTRRTDVLAAKLQTMMPLDLGKRDRLTSDDPVEEQYKFCYPAEVGSGRYTSEIAQAMIDRRRERQSLDALLDLVRHLDGLREERKAILLVSEGYLLYRDNPRLADASTPQKPIIGVGPTGRIGNTDRNHPDGNLTSQCDADRMVLANIDNWSRYRDLLAEANRANATFYPVDPQGLPVFDSDMGPNPPLPIDVDFALVKTRLDTLQMAAINTDGVAVINSNNIDAGLKRVVADLTSYYLLGYSSTNGKLDGRFREIKVRSRRPGVEIRARRGYRAPTEAEVAARVAASAPRVVDEATAAVEHAVSSLGGIRDDASFRLQVSPGWWTPPGPSAAGTSAAAEPALWIYGAVNTRPQGGDDWSKGGEAEIAILSKDGSAVTTFTVPVAATTGAFATRFPRTDADVWLDPGEYAVRVRARAAGSGLPTQDTARFALQAPGETTQLRLGDPIYARRGPATGNQLVRTADRRFRRTERLTVEVSSTLAPGSVVGELLDRTGKPLGVPVTAAVAREDGVVWLRGDVALSALAPGDYVVRLTATDGGQTRQMLAPFRVVP